MKTMKERMRDFHDEGGELHKEVDERIRKVIERLVQHYTYGLERRIEKGSNFWRGRIHTFKGGK